MFIIVSLCLYSLNSLSLVLSFSPPPHTIFMCVQFVVKSLVVGGPFIFFPRAFSKMSVNVRVWRSFSKSKYNIHATV